jgi:hypothetical protein
LWRQRVVASRPPALRRLRIDERVGRLQSPLRHHVENGFNLALEDPTRNSPECDLCLVTDADALQRVLNKGRHHGIVRLARIAQCIDVFNVDWIIYPACRCSGCT